MFLSFEEDGQTENRVRKEPEEKLYGRVRENSPLKNNSSSYFSQLIYGHHSDHNIFHLQNILLHSPLAVFPLWCCVLVLERKCKKQINNTHLTGNSWATTSLLLFARIPQRELGRQSHPPSQQLGRSGCSTETLAARVK